MGLTRLMLVEGVRDQQAIVTLLNQQESPLNCWYYGKSPYEDEKIYIAKGDGKTPDVGGYETLAGELNNWLKFQPTLKYIGIVVDADESVASRWQALWNVLNIFVADLSKVLPSERPDLSPDGLVFPAQIQYRDVTMGVWIMPDNQFPNEANRNDYGILESFLAYLVEQDSPLWRYAQEVIEELETQLPDSTLSYTQLPKGHLYTWLSLRDPGTMPDAAIKEGYLNSRAPLAQAFVAWVRRTFAL